MAIEWKSLNQPYFDRIIEALTPIHFGPGRQVRSIDGRGGDGGRDILVFDGDRLDCVLQLKFFPEGFSGPYNQRRKQITQSWNSVRGVGKKDGKTLPRWPNGKPEKWILVVPCKLSDSAHKFLKGLVSDSGVQLEIWDQPWLDAWMAKNQDFYEHFATDLLTERAKLFGQEKTILAGGRKDLDDRLRGLKKVTDAVDPHWTIDFSVEGETTTQTVRAKHPLAAKMSPLGLSLNGTFGPEHFDIKDSLERLINYGTPGSVTLPEDVLTNVSLVGPEWFAETWPGGRFTIQTNPKSRTQVKKIRLRILDEDGRLRMTYESNDLHHGTGRSGGSLTAHFYRVLTVTVLFDFQTHDVSLNLEPYSAFAGVSVADAVRAAKLIRDLSTEGNLEISVDGQTVANLLLTNQLEGNELDEFMALAEDLEVIEKATGSFSRVPETLTAGERVLLRAARLFLEGKCTYLPGHETLTMTLKDCDLVELREMTNGEPFAIRAHYPATYLKIGEEEVALLETVWSHPQVVLENAAEVLIALDSGQAEGISLTLAGAGVPFRIVQAQVFPADGSLPLPEPLGLTGFKESTDGVYDLILLEY